MPFFWVLTIHGGDSKLNIVASWTLGHRKEKRSITFGISSYFFLFGRHDGVQSVWHLLCKYHHLIAF